MNKKYLFIMVILLTIFECFLLGIYSPKEKTFENVKIDSIEENKKVKYIEEIEEDFYKIKNLNIKSYKKIDNENWSVSCSVKGKKDEILDFLDELNDYKISNYNFIYENENIILDIEIISK